MYPKGKQHQDMAQGHWADHKGELEAEHQYSFLSASQLEMQCNQLHKVQATLNFQVFHHSSKKTTMVLPKQHVTKKTPNTVRGGPSCSPAGASSLLCFEAPIKRTSSAVSLPPPQVQDLLTLTSASLFIVSRRAFWNTVISKQQVASMLALQADTTSVLEIGHTVLAQRMAVWKGKRERERQALMFMS